MKHERGVGQTNIVSTLLLLGICSLNVLLAHSIAVNTSHRSYGYYKPGHTSPRCIRLGYLEKARKAHFLPLFISRISSHSIVSQPISSFSYHWLTSLHAQSAPDHFQDSFQSWFRGKLEDLTGTSNKGFLPFGGGVLHGLLECIRYSNPAKTLAKSQAIDQSISLSYLMEPLNEYSYPF
jgi:hypothetical protein